MAIHPSAIVEATAEIDSDVNIGAYAVVEGHARVGAGTRLYPHAFVGEYTTIGERCNIHPFAVVGHIPQDLKWEGGRSYTRIGDETTVREGASIHRACQEDGATVIGDRCLIMAISHVGHDCRVGNEVKLTNSALLAGHVEVGNGAVIGGNTGVHQFVRVGELAMVGGGLRTATDVLPFMMQGPDGIVGPNVVGMRRAGHSSEERQEIRLCHRLLFRANLTMREALEEIEDQVSTDPGRRLVEFLRAPSQRGFEGLRHKHR